MGNHHISAIRLQNNIDVYITQSNHDLKHYWAGDLTYWEYHSQIIWKGVASKTAILRLNNDIDLYFITLGYQLIHMWCGDRTNWVYQYQILLSNVSLSSSPAACRFNDFIDVYCFSNDGNLVHLYVSPLTDWKYQKEQIYHSNNQKSSLCVLRTLEETIDIYFAQEGSLAHMHCGNHSQWKYILESIPINQHLSQGNIYATRLNNDIDLFFTNQKGLICQMICSDRTQWKYQNKNQVANGACKAKGYSFSVIRYENHIDLYYIGDDNKVWHTYSGANNGWNWDNPSAISQANADFGIIAIRPMQKAIDVFYIGQNDEMRNLFIGEGTGYDWSRYQSNSILKPTIRWEDIRQQCKKIGQGYHSETFLWQGKNLLIKKMKKPNLSAIRQEIKILNLLNPIWENICQFQLTENGQCVGFIIKYFDGKDLSYVLQQKDNIYHKSSKARIRLIKNLGRLMNKIQGLGICHGDFSLANVLVKQKNSQIEAQSILIIDFGNSFTFDNNTMTNQVLTGWIFLKPPQSRNNSNYNPSGVNAYQFGRVALQVLLKTKWEQYKQIPENPSLELKELKERECDLSVINYLEKLFQNNLQNRINQLANINNLTENIHIEEKKTNFNGHSTNLNKVKIKVIEDKIVPIYHISFKAGQKQVVDEISLKKFIKKIIPDLAYLANYLGFAWCGSQNIGEGFQISKVNSNEYIAEAQLPQPKIVTKYAYNRGGGTWYEEKVYQGYRYDQRLKIKIKDFKYKILKSIQKNVETLPDSIQVLHKFTSHTDNRKGKKPAIDEASATKKIQTTVTVEDSSTKSWEVGTKIQTSFKSPKFLGGGVDVMIGVQAKGGGQNTHSVKTQSKQTLEFSKKINYTVEPGQQGTSNSVMDLDLIVILSYSVSFKGFMRAEADHGHRHKKAQNRETIQYQFGNEDKNFFDSLKEEVQNQEESVWKWKQMFQLHPDSKDLVQRLKSQKHETTVSMKIKGSRGSKMIANIV